ncbi:V-set domain containing T-cell activation inhibitor 1-like isoform X2 [Myripristis murdjan]|uniref:V-set domain containing T-cell activation inhibitor 1-like isoform X2 n=1 Tax=Myripristis murdjan TaxID=586833 RepID=UPI00117616A9|nr:V-set domain containing T-cell activation inhibitor 1-like isoform X2 [Myripristis murdjan]
MNEEPWRRTLSETVLLSIVHLEAGGPALNLNLRARPGDDVTLICQAPDVDIAAAEWSRTDLEELQYVFLYRDGHIDSDYQHQSFKNRVELKDKEMKNGNLSVILKNVKEEDSGTYECRFKAAGEGRRKRAFIKTKPISTIQLEVADPDPGELKEQDEDPAVEAAGSQPDRVKSVAVIVLVLVVLAV